LFCYRIINIGEINIEMHTSSENYNNSNEYTDFLINDETKEAEIFKMDTVTFIKKYGIFLI